MFATPLLAGAILRVVNGVLVDRIGPKTTGLIGQIIVIAGLLIAWHFGVHSFAQVLLLGVVLGVAGASFAVALPLASRWYPPEYQGIALGIAGAGNSGTVFAALLAPGLAAAFGWTNVLGLAAIPLVIALAVYIICAKDSPNQPPPKTFVEYLAVLRESDAWCLKACQTLRKVGRDPFAMRATNIEARRGLDRGLIRRNPVIVIQHGK